MSTNDGGPAFPMPIAASADGGFYSTQEVVGERFVGMTLRDYFAAHFMSRAQSLSEHIDGGWEFENVAHCAYAMADAMLAERAKGRA